MGTLLPALNIKGLVNFNFIKRSWGDLRTDNADKLFETFRGENKAIVLPDKKGNDDLILLRKNMFEKILNLFSDFANSESELTAEYTEIKLVIEALQPIIKDDPKLEPLSKLLELKIKAIKDLKLKYNKPQHEVNTHLSAEELEEINNMIEEENEGTI